MACFIVQKDPSGSSLLDWCYRTYVNVELHCTESSLDRTDAKIRDDVMSIIESNCQMKDGVYDPQDVFEAMIDHCYGMLKCR